MTNILVLNTPQEGVARAWHLIGSYKHLVTEGLHSYIIPF